MARPAPTRAAARPVDGGRGSARAQGVLALLLLGAVVALDQATKAWAWRHVPDSIINAGSGLGGPVNAWFSGSSSGAALDVVDTAGLCAAGLALVRVPRRPAVLVSAALMIAGWGSNLLDRLGLHGLTAPGSVRGAVDFICVGRLLFNVADLVITAATAALVVLVVRSRPHLGHRRGAPRGRPVRALSRVPGGCAGAPPGVARGPFQGAEGGGGHPRVSAVTITTRSTGDVLRIVVRDDGAGLVGIRDRGGSPRPDLLRGR